MKTVKRPDPNFDATRHNANVWMQSHRDYRRVTGKCSICDRKLIASASGSGLYQVKDCPQGH